MYNSCLNIIRPVIFCVIPNGNKFKIARLLKLTIARRIKMHSRDLGFFCAPRLFTGRIANGNNNGNVMTIR